MFTNEQLDVIGAAVNGVEFDIVFWLDATGKVHKDIGENAPSAYHNEGASPPDDVWLDSVLGREQWETVTDGLTRQYGYRGAVMHSSEFIGRAVAERLTDYEPGTFFVTTTVQVLATVDDDDPAPAGWVVLRKL